MDFTGKVVVVTGAGSGIGRLTAQQFAAAGARVVIAEQRQHTGEETRRLIAKAGGDALAVRADVSQTTDVDAALDAAMEWAGRLDILVNTAEITNRRGPLVRGRASDFDRVMAVNVRGAFLITREMIKRLLTQDEGGRIICLSSYAAQVAVPDLAIYGASQAAVVALVRAAAAEVAEHGITVNCVCRGIVDAAPAGGGTAQWAAALPRPASGAIPEEAKSIPLGRIQTPEEVVSAVMFLASEDAAYITGQALEASGGLVTA